MLIGDLVLVGMTIGLFIMSVCILTVEARHKTPEELGVPEPDTVSERDEFNLQDVKSRRLHRSVVGLICLTLSIGLGYRVQAMGI